MPDPYWENVRKEIEAKKEEQQKMYAAKKKKLDAMWKKKASKDGKEKKPQFRDEDEEPEGAPE